MEKLEGETCKMHLIMYQEEGVLSPFYRDEDTKDQSG